MQRGKKVIERSLEILRRILLIDEKLSFSSHLANGIGQETSFLIKLIICLALTTEFRNVARFLHCQIQNNIVAIR